MSVITWIVLGLIVGLLANAVPSAEHGAAVTVATGVAGALAGGWVGSLLFPAGTTGFFDASTWVTAIVGSIAVLLIHHALTNTGRGPLRRRTRR